MISTVKSNISSVYVLKKKKCPIEEREYLRDQRSKIGPRGSFQLGPTDKGAAKRRKLSATKVRQYDAYNKKQQLQEESVFATVSSEQISHSDSSQSSAEDKSDSVLSTRSFPASSETYSDLKTPRFGMELVRGDVSSRLGASLGNALMLDLHAMGLFKSSVNLKQIFTDKSKIDAEKARVKNKSDELHEDRIENLICIGIDGKVSKLVTYNVLLDCCTLRRTMVQVG